MALLHDYLKQQQSQNDVWTTREQLCLASAVVKNGDQNWVAVSKTCQGLTTETNRPADWYSTKNCAFQYQKLLEKNYITKRRRDKDDSNNESHGEIVTKILAAQRIEELRQTMTKQKHSYEKLLNHINSLESGQYDHRIDEMWDKAVAEQCKKEEDERQQKEWLKERSERLLAMQRPLTSQIQKVDSVHMNSQESSSSGGNIPLEYSVVPSSSGALAQAGDENKKYDEIVIKTEVVDIEERLDNREEVLPEQPITQLQVVIESEAKKAAEHVKTVRPQDRIVQVDRPPQIAAKLERESFVNEASAAVEPLVSVKTEQLDKSVEKISQPDQNVTKTTPKRVDDTSKKSSQESADDIYAFDSDPESTEKKGITSFSLTRDDPKKADTFETFKSSRKRMRSFKESQQDELNEKVEATDTIMSASKEDEEFELPKKMKRIAKKDDEERKKTVEVDDDEVSRDSAEVKEFLMFVKSDRRRVYGHDDTASPVISESTPSSPASTYYGEDCESEKIYKTWKRSIMLVWNDIAAHKNASVFLRPISEEKVPGYHSIVYKPTDLQTIKRQIETGVIRTTQEFQREVLILFLNAKMYNRKDHNIFKMAHEMMKDCIAMIEEFNNTQLMAKSMDTPQKSLRRETRESSAKRSDVGIKRKRK